MNSQNVLPQQEGRSERQVDGRERECVGRCATGCGGRVPSRSSGGIAAGDFLAIEKGDEAAVVLHPEAGRVGFAERHLEWDAQLGPAPISLLARTRTHFDTGRGSQADLRATVGVYGRAGLFVALFGQTTWATDEWVRSYYGAGDGGLLFTALGIEGAYDLNRRWVLLASAHARRLHGDAASSPITEEKTNVFASAAIAYRF